MRRQIELHNKHYEVTVNNQSGGWLMQIEDGDKQVVSLLSNGSEASVIQLGDRKE